METPATLLRALAVLRDALGEASEQAIGAGQTKMRGRTLSELVRMAALSDSAQPIPVIS